MGLSVRFIGGQKCVGQLRGLEFTPVRVLFNEFKNLDKRQFTLVLKVKWENKSGEENTEREH